MDLPIAKPSRVQSRMKRVEDPTAVSRVRTSMGRGNDIGPELERQFPDADGFTREDRDFLARKLEEGRLELLPVDDEFFGFRYRIVGQQGIMAVVGKHDSERNGRPGVSHYVVLAHTSHGPGLVNKSADSLRETAYEAHSGINNRFIPEKLN